MLIQDLSEASGTELKAFLDSFDSVLCDCDGVLFLMLKPILGASDSLKALERIGKSIRFVSNNGSKTVESFTKTLQSYLPDARPEDTILPVVAIISYLKRIKFNRKLFIISFTSMKNEFRDAGFQVADSGPDSIEENFEHLFAPLSEDLDIGAVIFDTDINLNYLRLHRALVYIKRPDVLFITGSSDYKIPLTGDAVLIGSGYFQNILQDLAGKEPIEFGKPAKNLNTYILTRYNLNPGRTLFIGDAFTDMKFATQGGYQKMMVLTGVVKEDDLKKCEDKDLLPNYYLNSLGDLFGLINTKL